MSKLGLIVVGIIITVLGIFALFPAIVAVPMWLTIVLLAVGVLSIVLGLISKKAA